MATAFSIEQFVQAPASARARAVSAGIPVRAVRDFAARTSLTIQAIAEVIGSRRTLGRRLREETTLTVQESDRFAHLVAIVEHSRRVFGGYPVAVDWLTTPKRRLDGDTPLMVSRTTTGARVIEEWLIQAEHGMLA